MKRHVMELVLKLSALHRLIISVLMGIVMALFCYEFVINPLLIAIFGWIGFAVVFLAFDWVRIFVRKPDQILKKARQDDGTAPFVFFVILFSSCQHNPGTHSHYIKKFGFTRSCVLHYRIGYFNDFVMGNCAHPIHFSLCF